MALAHQCLLAAGAKEPILVTSSTASKKARDDALERLIERKDVAEKCLSNSKASGDLTQDEYVKERALLASVDLPVIEAYGDRGANPLRWVDDALPLSKSALNDGLRLMGPDQRRLRSTFEPVVQRDVKMILFEQINNDIRPRLSTDVCVAGCAQPIDYFVAVAERRPDGDLAAIAVVGSDEGMLYGPVSDGGVLGLAHRSVGSAGKLPTMVCGVRYGAKQSYCRSDRWRLSDPGGIAPTSCVQESDFASRIQIMSESHNSAFAEWLSDISDDDLRMCLADMGSTVHEGLDWFNLRRTSAVGTKVLYTPAALMRASAAIAFGSATTPKLFEEQDNSASLLDLNTMLTDAQLQEVRSLAKSASGEAEGTLYGFRIPECETLAIKTGTVDSTLERQVRDKVVIWSGVCADRQLTAVVMIGSPRIDRALGDVRSVDVAKILRKSLSASLDDER